jgi:hypothetical protein
VILHSRADDVIPFADSEELVANSGLSPETLIEVGKNHRLAAYTALPNHINPDAPAAIIAGRRILHFSYSEPVRC